jgi:hypothetical protein
VKLIHHDASLGALRLVRILVFSVWFLRVAFKPLHELALIPGSLSEPAGLLALLPPSVEAMLHGAGFLYALKAAALLSFALVIAGVALRPSMVAACVLMTLFSSLWRGFAGHIDHESILVLYAGYLMTLFAFADRRAEAKGERIAPGGPTPAGIQLTTILAVLCFVYTMVGVFRTVRGTPGVYTGDSMVFWALRNSYDTADPTGHFGRYVTDYPWLGQMLKAGYPVITLFEVSSFLVLFSRWYRYAFLAVMIPFHLLSLFVLNVFFWENMVLYVLFFELGRGPREPEGAAAG